MKKITFLLVLAVLMAACNSSTNSNAGTDQTEESSPLPGEIQVAVMDVTGMHCEACEKTITEVLNGIEGVEAAKASLELEQAKVKFEPAIVSTEDLKAALEEKGYGVGNIEIIEVKEQDAGGSK